MKYHILNSNAGNKDFVVMNIIFVFLTAGLLVFGAYPTIPAGGFTITILMGILAGPGAPATFMEPEESGQ